MPSKQVVLIAEENPSVLSMLSRFFRKNGYEVFAAANAAEAVEVATLLSHLTLVVSDRELPGLSNSDLLRLVGDLHPQVQTVFTSTAVDRLSSDQVPYRVLRAQAPSPTSPSSTRSTMLPTLTKPFRLSDLDAVLNQLLSSRFSETPEQDPLPAPNESSSTAESAMPSAA